MSNKHDRDNDATKGISRRSFMAARSCCRSGGECRRARAAQPACRGKNERASPGWRIGFRAA